MIMIIHTYIILYQIHGDTKSKTKGSASDQYLQFDSGSLLGLCKKTEKFNLNLFMPHNKQQV